MEVNFTLMVKCLCLQATDDGERLREGGRAGRRRRYAAERERKMDHELIFFKWREGTRMERRKRERGRGRALTFRRMNELFAFMAWPIAPIMTLQLLICHLSDYSKAQRERQRGGVGGRESEDGDSAVR